MESSTSPLIKLTDYQKESVMDRSRFRLDLWSRQSGKTFANMLHIALGAIERAEKWVVLSSGERMSKENIEVCKMHAQAIGAGLEAMETDYRTDDGTFKMEDLRFPTGGRIQGLPANPATARGHSANIDLDEFSTHKDSRKIWGALFPAITRGHRVRVQFTPLGKQNKAYELYSDWSKNAAAGVKGYRVRKVTIYDAIQGGLELRDPDGEICAPEDLQRGLGDDELWEQEYLCEFVDEASAYISYELINQCEDPNIEITPPWAKDLVARAWAAYERYRETKIEAALDPAEIFDGVVFENDLLLGGDIGRTRDRTSFWLDEKSGRLARARAVIRLSKTPFYVQQLVLHAILAHPKLRRACLDKSGIGAMLAENAALKFGAWKVEGVDFTVANKEALAGKFRESLEDHRRVLPAEASIRNSIHSVKRYATPTGHFRFDAERTDQTGHADDFWAAALAEMAGSGPGVEAFDIGSDDDVGATGRSPAHGIGSRHFRRTDQDDEPRTLRGPRWMQQ